VNLRTGETAAPGFYARGGNAPSTAPQDATVSRLTSGQSYDEIKTWSVANAVPARLQKLCFDPHLGLVKYSLQRDLATIGERLSGRSSAAGANERFSMAGSSSEQSMNIGSGCRPRAAAVNHAR